MLPHRAFAIAVFAELAYVAGRTMILPALPGPITAELAVTTWRLLFLALYLWLCRELLRQPGALGLRMPRHPVLLGAIALFFGMMPLAGQGGSFDLATRIVYTLTIPIVALREELFYRVILQGTLERKLHPLAAVVLASVAFLLFHIGVQPMTPLGVSSITVAGVMLGLVYQRTRSLWAVVMIHGAIDIGVLWLQSSTFKPFVALLGMWCALLAVVAWWSLERSRQRMGI